MTKLVFLHSAREDLTDIFHYILRESQSADIALRMTDLLYEKCSLLADQPRMGRRRLELRSDIRSFPVRDYVIFYREREEGVEIVNVLHGSRDITSQFEGER